MNGGLSKARLTRMLDRLATSRDIVTNGSARGDGGDPDDTARGVPPFSPVYQDSWASVYASIDDKKAC